MAASSSVVVVADPLDAAALELFGAGTEVVDATAGAAALADVVGRAHALLVRSRTKVNADLLARAPSLKVIGRAGVGVDNIDMAQATRRKIPVVNAPAAATTSVAELTVGLLISVARDFGSQVPKLKGGEWAKAGNGRELAGRTVGFVGYGRIAREVGARLKAFGMQLQAHDPFLTSSPDGIALRPLDDLLATSDVVSLHANLTPENRHLIDAPRLARMKAGAILINVARGPLVDETALLQALESGHLGGAGLDVFEAEPPKDTRLLAHPRVVATPHIGASTHEAQARAGRTTVEEVLKVLRGESPQFCVNPEVMTR